MGPMMYDPNSFAIGESSSRMTCLNPADPNFVLDLEAMLSGVPIGKFLAY